MVDDIGPLDTGCTAGFTARVLQPSRYIPTRCTQARTCHLVTVLTGDYQTTKTSLLAFLEGDYLLWDAGRRRTVRPESPVLQVACS